MGRRGGFGGHHFDPEINERKGATRLKSHIRLGIPLRGWGFKKMGAAFRIFPRLGSPVSV